MVLNCGSRGQQLLTQDARYVSCHWPRAEFVSFWIWIKDNVSPVRFSSFTCARTGFLHKRWVRDRLWHGPGMKVRDKKLSRKKSIVWRTKDRGCDLIFVISLTSLVVLSAGLSCMTPSLSVASHGNVASLSHALTSTKDLKKKRVFSLAVVFFHSFKIFVEFISLLSDIYKRTFGFSRIF